MKTSRKITLIVMFVLVLLAAAAFYAPGYLLYATSSQKADTIVLLLGPDFNARLKHAHNLIKGGMSDYLIIPAYHKTYCVDQGMLLQVPNKTEDGLQFGNKYSVPRYFEDTHIELMDARETMRLHGKKTAIFVSSPYHMRRIQIIVEKVFDADHKYHFSPTPYETAPEDFHKLRAVDWKKVFREYAKICWFKIYSLWET